jgi:hypothetical protein
MWYAIDVQSLVVHTFHGMDRSILAFGKVVNKKIIMRLNTLMMFQLRSDGYASCLIMFLA